VGEIPNAGLPQQARWSWGQPDPGDAGEGGSSPDKAGTCRHHQTVRAWQAKTDRWTKGTSDGTPYILETGSNLVDLGRAATSASRNSRRQAALSSIQEVDGGGRGGICVCPTARCRGRAGHQSRHRGSVVNVGTAPVSPFPPAIQVGGGQARRLLMTPGRGGAPVVVRGRESRPHGEGGQQSRSVGTGRPGGRW
jgi:hypothetical protein